MILILKLYFVCIYFHEKAICNFFVSLSCLFISSIKKVAILFTIQ